MSTATEQIPEGYTKEEFNMLSKPEQEALRTEIDDKQLPQVVEEGGEEAKAAEAKAKAKADADEAAKVAADAAAAEKAKEGQPAAAAAKGTEQEANDDGIPDATDPRPLIPTIKVSKLVSDEEHSQAQAALAKKFEDGEITTPQFIIENDRLSRAKMESDLAQRSSAQNEELSWQARQDAFFSVSGNEVIRDDPRVWAAMQAQLETMYTDPKCKDYSDMQFLNEAGREVRRLFGIEPAAAAPAPKETAKSKKAPAGTEVDTPTTLADAPIAADNGDTQGASEFDKIDSLSGMEYELAFAKLTPEQKARYLAI